MPELPEVETIRRELARILIGKTIKTAQVLWPKAVAPLGTERFTFLLQKKKVVGLSRLAKILIIDLEGPASLAFHLKMTGQLIFKSKGKTIVGGHPAPEDEKVLPNSHTRLIISFSDGSKLYFNDMRKFGWARLIDDTETKLLVGHIGPDPLTKDFTVSYLSQIIKKYPGRSVKQILMDQSLIAGIGNIYSDEATFLAGVRPDRKAKTLSPAIVKKLHKSIVKVLKLSIQKKGTSSRNYRRSNGKEGGFVPYLNVYGRGGKPCKACGTIIKKIKHNGRGTVYCPYCQK